jgi:hypothetical protein
MIMTKRRVVWISVAAATAVGLAAGAGLSGHEEVSSDAPAAEPSSATRPGAVAGDQERDARQLTRLGQELTAMRSELAAMREQMGKAHAPAEPTAREEGEDEGMRAARRAEGDAMHQARLASVDSAFRGEPNNPQWAASTSSSIREALAAAQIDASKLRAMECRSRTCRIELVEDESSDLSKTLPMFALQVGRALPAVTADHIDDGHGRRTAVLYLSSHP